MPTASITPSQIAEQLQVTANFNVQTEIESRIGFLCHMLRSTQSQVYVLGISGGVDSLLAGLLCQQAVQRLRTQGFEATFYAMRLPYGTQHDEDAAQECLRCIAPDHLLTVDIRPATDAMHASLKNAGTALGSSAKEDFLLGNIKARQRMIAQYAVAAAYQGLVVGTDQAAEALMGFFTKFGDGAADLTPLTGLTKRRVRALASALGAPAHLVHKTPTADLENLRPLRPDEDAFGVSYDEIDNFLEGVAISPEAQATIIRVFNSSQHKRDLPVTPRAAPASNLR